MTWRKKLDSWTESERERERGGGAAAAAAEWRGRRKQKEIRVWQTGDIEGKHMF